MTLSLCSTVLPGCTRELRSKLLSAARLQISALPSTSDFSPSRRRGKAVSTPSFCVARDLTPLFRAASLELLRSDGLLF